jgi:hypothetical protein
MAQGFPRKSVKFDGSDLKETAFGLIKFIISTYGDQKFEMSNLFDQYIKNTGGSDKRPLATQTFLLTQKGYLNYFEEPQPGYMLKKLQATPEAIAGLENVVQYPGFISPPPIQHNQEDDESDEIPEEQIESAVAEYKEYQEAQQEPKPQPTPRPQPKPQPQIQRQAPKSAEEELKDFLDKSQKGFDKDAVAKSKVFERMSTSISQEKQHIGVKEIVDKEIAPIYDKLELLAKSMVLLNQNITQMSQNLNVKKHTPQEVRAEYVGGVREIVANIKNISLEGTDESIIEVLKTYKEARRDGNSMQEREYAWNAVPRLESMISWYLHLTTKMGGYIAYLERKFGENAQNEMSSGEAVEEEVEQNAGK